VKKTILIIVVSALLLYSAQAFATYYKWTDEKGKQWLTDYPNPKKANKKVVTEAARDKLDVHESSTSGPVNRIEKKNEGSGNFLVPDDTRKKIENISGVNLSGISGATLSLIAVFAFALIAALYFYFSFCLFLIARRLAIPDAWMAFVPIVNLLVLIRSAGMPQWWMALMVIFMLLTLIPVLGLIFYILFNVCFVYFWMLIAHNLGKNRWLGLLMIVPVANIIFPGFLAFSKTSAPPETETVNAATNVPGETMQDSSPDRWP
jgi:hypothetical protein